MQKKGIVISLVVLAAVIVAAFLWFGRSATRDRELNILAWTGYEERSMIEPFEKLSGLKVNIKTFVGGDQMFALLTQSKNTYDVVVVDPEYISKLYAAGRMSRLNPSDYKFDDYFEPFKKFPLCWIDNQLYAVLVRWGSNGLVYNTKYLSAADVSSYSILWDPKVKGKVGIWDWYVPSMGVLSKAGGNSDAYNISDAAFDDLKGRLFDLRPQVAAISPTAPEMISALAAGQTWIVPGAGEWVASVLQQQGLPIDWDVPREGGIMWVETLVIPNDAPHPQNARSYIQWMQTPEAQALLSQRQAYNSNVPNKKAYDLLTQKQRASLKVLSEADAIALISRLSVRQLPVNQSESVWQGAWQAFKAR